MKEKSNPNQERPNNNDNTDIRRKRDRTNEQQGVDGNPEGCPVFAKRDWVIAKLVRKGNKHPLVAHRPEGYREASRSRREFKCKLN